MWLSLLLSALLGLVYCSKPHGQNPASFPEKKFSNTGQDSRYDASNPKNTPFGLLDDENEDWLFYNFQQGAKFTQVPMEGAELGDEGWFALLEEPKEHFDKCGTSQQSHPVEGIAPRARLEFVGNVVTVPPNQRKTPAHQVRIRAKKPMPHLNHNGASLE